MRTWYPVVRGQFNQGLLTASEFEPHREKVVTLGLDEDDAIQREFIDLGLKGDHLKIVDLLSSASAENPLTAQEIARRADLRKKKSKYKGSIGSIYPSHFTDKLSSIRMKLRKGGYVVAIVDMVDEDDDSVERIGSGYFLVKLPSNQSSTE